MVFGKINNSYYYKRKGVVICRDPYYKDYNIKFDDGSEDWFDEEYLTKLRKEKRKHGNKKN